jgi:urea transport system permease protein
MLETNPPTRATPEVLPADAAESRLAYERSRTFVTKLPDPAIIYLRRGCLVGVLALGFVLIPLLNTAGIIPDYRVNFLGKYLCFAIAALGIDLIWGYTGLLSLCQALFFCIGGYVMAMHLSLPEGGGDVRPEYNNIPQFMFFNNLTSLPLFWRPFASFPATVIAVLALPTIVAAVFGFFILRSRVKGVYFSIITQALAWSAWLLISRNEMLLGGSNGLTNFYKPMTQKRSWILGLYLLTLAMVVVSYLLCRALVGSRLGRVLIAVRDRESRLYFAGYKPYAFKVFAFAVGAMLAGVGGALYPAQVGIINPYNMNVATSIDMVIWVAVGGRGKLWGAVFGALLVNIMLSSVSSDLPSVWPFIQGGLFIGVVLLFPDGFVGIWSKLEEQVAVRAGWARILVTASPLIVTVGFILTEGLGLTPAFLRYTVNIWVIRDPVALKYVLIVLLLGGAGAAYMVQKRRDAVLRSGGFSVAAAGVAA